MGDRLVAHSSHGNVRLKVACFSYLFMHLQLDAATATERCIVQSKVTQRWPVRSAKF